MSIKISVIIPVYNAEDYLIETLDSLVNQTFKDFEAIIVNDGSTDQSQKIINYYCNEHPNFKSFIQTNSGVSKARNKGIDESNGDYITFLDSDDLFTPKALENFYKAAFENDAELVIGGIREFDNFGSRSYSNPKILSKMKEISKFEKNIVWNFLLGNKLYLREKINQLGLRFIDVNYSEDGVFVMEYVYNCDKITGCNYEVLCYRKRNFWEKSSITQSIETKSVNDYLFAHKMIYDAAEKSLSENYKKAESKGEISEAIMIYYDYLDYITFKEVFILFDHFYRKFWRLDDDSLKLIISSIMSFEDLIFPSSWKKFKKPFSDLRIDDLISDKSVMASNPIITIALNHENIDEKELESLLSSIYAQDFPAFELLINSNLTDIISNKWFDYVNLYVVESNDRKSFKNDSLAKSKGEYILFIEDPIILEPKTLRHNFIAINSKKYLTMSSAKIRRLFDNTISEYISQELAYTYRNTMMNSRKSKFNKMDLYLSNKVINTDFLKRTKFKFSNDSTADAKKLYEKTKFKKLDKNYIFSVADEKTLIKSLRSHDKSINFKIGILNLFKTPIYTVVKIRRIFQHRRLEIKSRFKRKLINIYIRMLKILPLRNRVFFYSIRSNDSLLENSLSVYERLDTNKIFASKILPHTNKTKLKMLYYLVTSKVIVSDDYLRYLRLVKLRKEQKVIQLWHACGAFKKFSLDHPSNDIITEIYTHSQYDDVIVSSEYVRKHYASAFGLPIDKIKALGVPRTDIFFDEKHKTSLVNNLYKQYPLLKNKKIILYCPTFKEDENGKLIPLNTKIDWKKLNDSLNDNELFVIKKHPLMKEDLLEGQNYSKIIDLSRASTYALMLASDGMITDYSSVIFEYSLLNKPILLYSSDEFKRDFYLKYPEDLPGKLVLNSDELIKEIPSLITNPSDISIEEFKTKQMNSCDGNSTERVLNLIKTYLTN